MKMRTLAFAALLLLGSAAGQTKVRNRVPVRAAATVHGISFNWTDTDPTVATYNLYCATTAGGEATPPTITGIKLKPYLWTGGTPGTTYFCTLTAVNAVGEESAMSNETGPTIFPQPPQAPSAVTATPK